LDFQQTADRSIHLRRGQGQVGQCAQRSGRQHEASLLGQVEKYYAFKVITEQDHWVEVEDEMENRGWVSKSLVWMN
jgi:SH3-like domain-containing protein